MANPQKFLSLKIPYSERFSLVQTEFHENASGSSEEIFAVLFSRNECMMLWPHPYQLMATPDMWTKETTLNNKVKKFVQQQPSLPFVWRPSQLRSIRTTAMGEKLACWAEGFSTTDLDLDNFGVSLTCLLAFCILADLFFSTLTI